MKPGRLAAVLIGGFVAGLLLSGCSTASDKPKASEKTAEPSAIGVATPKPTADPTRITVDCPEGLEDGDYILQSNGSYIFQDEAEYPFSLKQVGEMIDVYGCEIVK